MNHTRVFVWSFVALLAGALVGGYMGYSFGYDQAVNYFVAVK